MKLLVCLLLVLCLASGCAGTKTGTFDANVYRKGKVAFRVPATPNGWRRVGLEDASLAFRDDAHSASILLNARCLSADDRTPLVALTNHLLIGATEREFVNQAVEQMDSREALHTKLKAKWDGVPMSIDVYVLSKDGCVYDFVYFGAPAAFDDGAGLFEGFVRGFRTLPGSGVV